MKSLVSKNEVVTARIAASSALLTAFHAKSGRGLAIELNSQSRLNDLARHLLNEFSGLKIKDLSLKLVGADSLLQSARKAIEASGGSVEKSVAKDSAFLAYFYPSEGRLRIEKSESAE